LRVNYGEGGWVESFYEAGHTVWINITESDGITLKATAEVWTESRDEWGGETGFQTTPDDWFPSEPDIVPYDWVFAWVDNGASAQVQIGEISGMIDFESDSILGSINAPWFSGEEVSVECHPWGAPEPQPAMKFDTILPDDADPYHCSWAGEWQIQPGQVVGVGYYGPDNHWVANVFDNNARIVASESGDWFWTTDFAPETSLTIFIYDSNDPSATLLWNGSRDSDEWGFIWAGYDDHLIDLVPDNYLVITDGTTTKSLIFEPISVTSFNTIDDTMAGTAPAGREVLAAAGPQEYQEGIWVTADPGTGEWFADFKTIGFNILEEMRPWSWAQIFDDDGDANEGSTPPPPEIRAWLGNQRIEGYQWSMGAEISLYINDSFIDSQTVTEGDEFWTFVGFDLHGWVLEPGQQIYMVGGGTEKTHTILPVSITLVDVDLNRVEGTATENGRIIFCLYEGGCDPPAEIFVDGSGFWFIEYGEDPDILPGHGMDATEFDEDGDGTSFDYWIPEPIFWRDDFEGSIAEDWYWINENPEKWNLTEQPGFLRIYASQYGTAGENLLLRLPPEGDFVIETHLLFEPDTNFQFAGLVIFQDSDNFLQFGRAYCDYGACPGNAIYFDHIEDGGFVGDNFATPMDPPHQVFLRLERQGDMITGFYSPDGDSWFEIGTHWLAEGFEINGVGLTASGDTTPEGDIPADFDYFELIGN
jgi:regulation of enolase protein 1 (concanavalin A-like superfamily)